MENGEWSFRFEKFNFTFNKKLKGDHMFKDSEKG